MDILSQLRKQLEVNHIDGMLVTSPYNRRYVSGFTGSAGAVLITEKEAVFITDFRYTSQATKQVKGFTVIEHRKSLEEEIAKQINELQINRLGFESEHITYEKFKQFQDQFNTTLVDVRGIIETIRLVKSEEEVKIIQKAANIADAAFDHILSVIKPGVREIEIANELEFFMRKQGASSSSFDIIVASGYRGALPHGTASQKVIENGELVTMDFGALYEGYCSDITRTIAVGNISAELEEIYHIVLEAQKLGVKGTKPGITGHMADALTRDFIEEKGYGKYFGHSTGHGLGMEVHESPRLALHSEQVLKTGMVVTIEPGIYVDNVGGCRIEDDIVLTDNGNTVLTKAPKELIIL